MYKWLVHKGVKRKSVSYTSKSVMKVLTLGCEAEVATLSDCSFVRSCVLRRHACHPRSANLLRVVLCFLRCSANLLHFRSVCCSPSICEPVAHRLVFPSGIPVTSVRNPAAHNLIFPFGVLCTLDL